MTATVGPCDSDICLVGELATLMRFAPHHKRDAAYLGWLRDHEVLRTLNLPHYMERPVSRAEIDSYCDRLMVSSDDMFLAIHLTADNSFAGTLKAAKIDRYAGHADIGIMIGRKELWGQGLATDAIGLLCRYLFENVGMRRLTAGCMATNPGMIRVFEKLGFQREGVFRDQDRISETEFCDHIHLGCLHGEFTMPKRGDGR